MLELLICWYKYLRQEREEFFKRLFNFIYVGIILDFYLKKLVIEEKMDELFFFFGYKLKEEVLVEDVYKLVYFYNVVLFGLIYRFYYMYFYNLCYWFFFVGFWFFIVCIFYNKFMLVYGIFLIYISFGFYVQVLWNNFKFVFYKNFLIVRYFILNVGVVLICDIEFFVFMMFDCVVVIMGWYIYLIGGMLM